MHHDETKKTRRPDEAQHSTAPLTPTEARQGSRGRPVLIVLIIGLILAMLVWFPAEWWGNAIAPDHPAEDARQQTAPSPGGQQTESERQNIPGSNPTPGQ